jgi:hypothetical protein
MKIKLKDPTGAWHEFECKDLIDGIPIDPVMPARFGETDNTLRPPEHLAWLDVPYIVSNPSGPANSFTCYCLDGGAWDRPTWLGTYSHIDDAVESLSSTGKDAMAA